MAPVTPLPDPLTVLENAVLQSSTVEEYFQHFNFVDQTLARAEDVNRMQDLIELGFRRFGTSVQFSLDQLVLVFTAFANVSAERERLFEQQLQAKFDVYQTSVNQQIGDLRDYVDRQDQLTYKAANTYTDDQIAKLIKSLIDSTRFSTELVTEQLDDGGNYFGGKDYQIVVFNVPGAHTLNIHRWTFQNRATGDVGGAADEIRVTWTGFLGYESLQNADAVSAFRSSGQFSASPITSIKGPAQITAAVFVNNIKCIETFGLEGYLVPDAYVGLV
jgi:hypothetical protein